MTTSAVVPRSMPIANPDQDGHRGSSLTGLLPLLRLTLRRDRLRISMWTVGAVGLVLATAASITALYDTPQELAQYAALVRGNSALIVQAGPGYGLDDPTIGAVMMNELAVWLFVAVSVMNVFAVVRHTRTEEVAANAELTRAAPTGRNSGTAAALVSVTIANLIIAIGVTAVLSAYGLAFEGTLGFATSLLGVASVFAGVAAVAAQVVSNPRSALGIGGGAIAVAFVLRAVGDVGDGRLSWLSPLGWGLAMRSFADERWWVLLLPMLATSVLVVTAFALQSRRDFGSGMVSQRAGRATAARSLRTPLRLAVRLQRASIVAWTIGLALMGFFYGIVADEAETIFDENPDMAQYLAQLGDASITDAFLATAILLVSLIATAFTVSSILRLRREESEHRADLILAAPWSRTSWAMSHLAVAVTGTIIVVAAMGAATGIGFAVAAGNSGYIVTLVGAALLMVPAVAVVAGVVMCVFGWWPHVSMWAWGAFATVVIIGLFGAVLDLPQWALNVSPFEHVPALPGTAFELAPVVVLVVSALALMGVGLAGVRRRDIG